ncbi:hypothetical protein MYIN104542_00235 [Mycobacterium intermedium]
MSPPLNAATNSGKDPPRLACNAAVIAADSDGALNTATRLAAKVWPASIRPSSPPPKFAARLAANSCATCANPLSPPLNAATSSGNDAPRLACNAALIDAASSGRVKLPARVPANVWPS